MTLGCRALPRTACATHSWALKTSFCVHSPSSPFAAAARLPRRGLPATRRGGLAAGESAAHPAEPAGGQLGAGGGPLHATQLHMAGAPSQSEEQTKDQVKSPLGRAGRSCVRRLACGRSSASSTMLRSSSSTVLCSISAFSPLQGDQAVRGTDGRQGRAAPSNTAPASRQQRHPANARRLRSLDHVQEGAEQADRQLLPAGQVQNEQRALDLPWGSAAEAHRDGTSA